MRSMDRLQVQASSGWKDIGNPLVTITGGFGDAGTALLMKGPTGLIRIMTTTAKAGKCTRDIGTMRTTTMATGETMIMIATIVIMTTMTTDHYALSPTFLPEAEDCFNIAHPAFLSHEGTVPCDAAELSVEDLEHYPLR